MSSDDKGPLSIYGWYGTGNIAYGTRMFFNCLDTRQEVFLRAFHTGQPLFCQFFSLITMLNLKYIDLNITSNNRSIKKILLILQMCLSLLSDSYFCTIKDTMTMYHS